MPALSFEFISRWYSQGYATCICLFPEIEEGKRETRRLRDFNHGFYTTFMAELKSASWTDPAPRGSYKHILGRYTRCKNLLKRKKTAGKRGIEAASLSAPPRQLVATLFALIITNPESAQVCIVYTMHQAALSDKVSVHVKRPREARMHLPVMITRWGRPHVCLRISHLSQPLRVSSNARRIRRVKEYLRTRQPGVKKIFLKSSWSLFTRAICVPSLI